MTTLNEHSLPHNMYNDKIHFCESDKDIKETCNCYVCCPVVIVLDL